MIEKELIDDDGALEKEPVVWLLVAILLGCIYGFIVGVVK